MQLDAFLRSRETCVRNPGVLYVSWRASSTEHAKAYSEVFLRHLGRIVLQPQVPETFKTDVLGLVPLTGFVSFFVDDQVFVREWDEREAVAGLSLRLGVHLSKCYPTASIQSLPSFRVRSDGRLEWAWREGDGDWGYPLSIDGHVFEARELRAFVGAVECRSPNTLEAALQAFRGRFNDRRGICYREAKVVNVPWNLVQEDWRNRHGHVKADELLGKWQSGFQIATSALRGVVNESCHQEFPLMLEERA